jgi:hypothetical protein
MRVATILVGCAMIGASILNGCYTSFGWHYFTMPFPDIIAPSFHLGGEAHWNAAESEVWLEFFVGMLAALAGARWVARKLSN